MRLEAEQLLEIVKSFLDRENNAREIQFQLCTLGCGGDLLVFHYRYGATLSATIKYCGAW
jgi:hypothetical protein